jgi:hypothetical protein
MIAASWVSLTEQSRLIAHNLRSFYEFLRSSVPFFASDTIERHSRLSA